MASRDLRPSVCPHASTWGDCAPSPGAEASGDSATAACCVASASCIHAVPSAGGVSALEGFDASSGAAAPSATAGTAGDAGSPTPSLAGGVGLREHFRACVATLSTALAAPTDAAAAGADAAAASSWVPLPAVRGAGAILIADQPLEAFPPRHEPNNRPLLLEDVRFFSSSNWARAAFACGRGGRGFTLKAM